MASFFFNVKTYFRLPSSETVMAVVYLNERCGVVTVLWTNVAAALHQERHHFWLAVDTGKMQGGPASTKGTFISLEDIFSRLTQAIIITRQH